MENKFTKGKWYVSKAHKTINDEKGFGIAQENGHRNSNEWDANALLISKAPEMLEMLIEITNQIEDGRNYITKEDIKQLIKEATEIQDGKD